MAVQSIPNQQKTGYTKNGFRTDVNKVRMPFGLGVPLQPIYNFILSPVLDSGNGSICAPQAFPGANTSLTLNQNPAAPVALANGTAVSLFDSSITTTTDVKTYTALPLNQQVAATFAPKQITGTVTIAGGTNPTVSITYTGFVAPGVSKTETVAYTSGTSAPTLYAYIGITSAVIAVTGTPTSVVISTLPTAQPTENSGFSNLLKQAIQTVTAATSLTLNSSVASAFPSQQIIVNITGTGSRTSGTTDVSINGTSNSLSATSGTLTYAGPFTSLSSINVTGLATGVSSVSISVVIQTIEVSVIYKSINGKNMSQLDCHRCIQISLTNTTGSSVNSVLSQVLITAYDNRFIQVQETLTLPITAVAGNSTVFFTSNKAYSYIQSIALSANPGANIQIGVSASNQFFGLPFYYSSDAVMTVVEPFLSGPDAGYITPAVQPGSNFYSSVPNAVKSVSLNTFTGSIGPGSTISDLDARGLIVLDQEITNSEDIITYGAYIYAADSFINAQLQNTDANPLAQQQLSNWITGTQGATVNDTTTWTRTNWATTALLDFDLTGAQFPGDQSQFNEIFNNQNLPTTATRFMGPALTVPSA